MEIIDQEVRFDKYCSSCIHAKEKDIEDPCDACLASGFNAYTDKPINYKEN